MADIKQPKTISDLKVCIADQLDTQINDPVAGRRGQITATDDTIAVSVEKGDVMAGGHFQPEGELKISGLGQNIEVVTALPAAETGSPKNGIAGTYSAWANKALKKCQP